MFAYPWYSCIMPVAHRCLYEYSVSKKKLFHRNLLIIRLWKNKTTQTRITYDCIMKYPEEYRHIHRKRRCLFSYPTEKQTDLKQFLLTPPPPFKSSSYAIWLVQLSKGIYVVLYFRLKRKDVKGLCCWLGWELPFLTVLLFVLSTWVITILWKVYWILNLP